MIENHFKATDALSLASFKEMDYLAVEQYNLPIPLMMENAGLQLANLIALTAKKTSKILIGIGNGNNGGGGLVAARRLAAWGFEVYLDIPVEITKNLPAEQLERALLFGAKKGIIAAPDIWVDAYLGFSQRLPLSEVFLSRIQTANSSNALKISLDIPMGVSEDITQPMFQADQVLTLAAPKQILNTLSLKTKIFIADIGIPYGIYEKFNIPMPSFFKS
ncbi:NAD(P)H-hydrate epimerase [Cellulophaga sp. HaHaR_3_176]|uniref:NAD(P)H-hydrate epimerase n=1 Tax=Cellulophaga sp. HaHaR_3_176 TaxID=1942464 RepID=UPI001C1F84CD|nr:NAD(P)H-hydrate epimerase [Cellulophaga sp. HaHaR_3_176]QWX83477.1 NAD(P)H-hydrate epimerase [Cellulophaga sp. HaHaR_3_176]